MTRSTGKYITPALKCRHITKADFSAKRLKDITIGHNLKV